MLVDPDSVNWWSVIVASLVGFAIVWYAPPMLGNVRIAALGKTNDQRGDPVKPMILQFLLTLVMAAVLAIVVVRFGAVTWIEGAAIGLALSVGLIATALLSDWRFCGFDMKPYWIQASCRVACITAMGAILGAWR